MVWTPKVEPRMDCLHILIPCYRPYQHQTALLCLSPCQSTLVSDVTGDEDVKKKKIVVFCPVLFFI